MNMIDFFVFTFLQRFIAFLFEYVSCHFHPFKHFTYSYGNMVDFEVLYIPVKFQNSYVKFLNHSACKYSKWKQKERDYLINFILYIFCYPYAVKSYFFYLCMKLFWNISFDLSSFNKLMVNFISNFKSECKQMIDIKQQFSSNN